MLGQRIHALREAKGWSLRRLSANSEISVAAIQKIEAGSANPMFMATPLPQAGAARASAAADPAEGKSPLHAAFASSARVPV
jgi:transcriptional regulator with XRE-family HTH domain